MAKKLFVGNLAYSVSEEEVRDVFAEHGTIHSIKLILDRDTGRSRGFAFVEMDDSEADAAMSALDGTEFLGRALRVNEAREREDRGPRQQRQW